MNWMIALGLLCAIELLLVVGLGLAAQRGDRKLAKWNREQGR